MTRTLLLIFLFYSPLSMAILRGEMATEEQNSSAVQIWSMKDNHLNFRCSGVMIAPDVVLTEATCLYETPLEKYGDTFLVSRSSKTDFSKSLANILQRILAIVRSDIRHPTENLVLLFLNQAVPVRPAILMQANEADQLLQIDTVFLAGWGYEEAPPSLSYKTRIYDYLWSTNSDPRTRGTKHIGKSHLSGVTNQELNFGDTEQDALACRGDEGGPIMIRVQSRYRNQERLIGIIASNPNLQYCSSPSFGLRIDVLQPFIKEQLELGCQKDERVWCEIKGLIPPDTETAKVIEIHSPTVHEPKIPTPVPETPPTREKVIRVKMESVGCHCSQSFWNKKKPK